MITLIGIGPGAPDTLTVEAEDACGNRAEYTFRWQYEAGQAHPGMTITRLGAA